MDSMTGPRVLFCLGALFGLCGLSYGGDDPVMLRFEQGLDGFQGFEDTSIFSESENAGGGTDGIFSGKNMAFNIRRALLQIDLSSIPEGSTIQAAELRLTVDMSGDNFGDINYTLHTLTKDWNEGDVVGALLGGRGGPAEPGDATWTFNFFQQSSWDSPGGDFVQTPSATAALGRAGDVGVFSGPGMVADVQDWVDDPSSNFGWLIKSTLEEQNTAQRVKRIYSSEAESNKPVLVLTVMLPDGGENPSDVNNDGVVNAIDVQFVINGALGLDVGDAQVDVNGDLVVNAVDVQTVINAALGL